MPSKRRCLIRGRSKILERFRSWRALAGLSLLSVGIAGISLQVSALPGDREDWFETWSAGLPSITEKEQALLRGFADDRATADKTKGITPEPGGNSEIVANPIFFDYVIYVTEEGQALDSRARQLVEQSGEKFFYFETGVSIDKRPYESIDALIFQASFDPLAVSTFSQTPDSQDEAILTIGGSAKLGLSGDLKVKRIGVEAGLVSGNLAGEAAASLTILGDASYTLKRNLVSAIGEGQGFARWTVDSDNLLKDDVRFVSVLRVPGTLNRFTVQVEVIFIDKLFFDFELSRSHKSLTYSCSTQLPACTVQ